MLVVCCFHEIGLLYRPILKHNVIIQRSVVPVALLGGHGAIMALDSTGEMENDAATGI